MIELRRYGKAELSAILKTSSKEGMTRKLERWGITFTEAGRGNSLEITITGIADPFKVYCITELNFGANTDFQKVRNLYYYFFNDDEFMAMPDEVKEHRLDDDGKHIARQTIASYLAKLDAKDFILRNTGEYIYYFALNHHQRIVECSEYKKAWREYWNDIDDGMTSREAIAKMIWNYEGVARKQEKPEVNGIYHAEIQFLCDLIQNSIESEQQP